MTAWRHRKDPDDVDAERDVDQALADLSQTLSDADQIASDQDASGSESDSAASQQDQSGADTDQLAADAEQASSDREFAAARDPSVAQRDRHAEAREQRASAAQGRRDAQAARAEAEVERIRIEVQRAETAVARDAIAIERDRAAEMRDAAARRSDAAVLVAYPSHAALRETVSVNAELRDRAIEDRQRAASDRRRAAEDRLTAAANQRQARIDVQRAQLDGQTGVYAIELGHATLRGEMDRCRRGSDPFVLALICIDGVRADQAREADDDALVVSVVHALRAKLRSYDPVVRVAGDEFLCGLPGTQPGAAHDRIDEIRCAVQSGHPPGTITVGFAAMEMGDTLGTLIDRAAADLGQTRPASGSGDWLGGSDDLADERS